MYPEREEAKYMTGNWVWVFDINWEGWEIGTNYLNLISRNFCKNYADLFLFFHDCSCITWFNIIPGGMTPGFK